MYLLALRMTLTFCVMPLLSRSVRTGPGLTPRDSLDMPIFRAFPTGMDVMWHLRQLNTFKLHMFYPNSLVYPAVLYIQLSP